MGAAITQFIAAHGVWVAAAFIALETVGAPLPAEAVLIAAAVLAPSHGEVGLLIAAGIAAAVAGNIAGFWLGRRFGTQLLARHGARVGLTLNRVRIGHWLFRHYGAAFVFVARFLPFLRNMAALLAGANDMPARAFYVASSLAAVAWVTLYGLCGYGFGEAFRSSASPAVTALALAVLILLVALPMAIVRSEKRLLARIEQDERREPPA
jgi:membrane protein DedA with SNARE-associated domain